MYITTIQLVAHRYYIILSKLTHLYVVLTVDYYTFKQSMFSLYNKIITNSQSHMD